MLTTVQGASDGRWQWAGVSPATLPRTGDRARYVSRTQRVFAANCGNADARRDAAEFILGERRPGVGDAAFCATQAR